MPIHHYFPRRLSYTDNNGGSPQERILSESALLEYPAPRIVLGEPGMGKSELLAQLSIELEVEVTSASRFMQHPAPAKLMKAGKPLLIDGLDEAIARNEGQAFDAILGKLDALEAPDFVLACRAREWQSRNLTELKDIYRERTPVVFHLQPFERADAAAFLAACHEEVDADRVLDHLDQQGVSQLYHNPLTLDLMGKVASQEAELPATRSELFERVCILIWPEHDPERRGNPLQDVTNDQALACAGAIMAGMLLCGADAISLTRSVLGEDNDVDLAELTALPGAGQHARGIVSSKLFQSLGINRVRPIHRVISEYLAARWLADQAGQNRRKISRLLARFQGDGKVPASYRGVHAWLAHHSPLMTEKIIAFDPLGVLRYGETARLSPALARHLFESLQALTHADPYFRLQDWDSHTAKGLMIEELRQDIDNAIGSNSANAHLSSLLIDGLKGTALAKELAPTLLAVMLDPQRAFVERSSAAIALKPHRNAQQWEATLMQLLEQFQHSSVRLARSLIESLDFNFSDELLVATLLAELGVGPYAVPESAALTGYMLHDCSQLIKMLPTRKVAGVITLLCRSASQMKQRDSHPAWELSELIAWLIARAINERLVTYRQPDVLWGWLVGVRKSDIPGRGESTLQNLLDSDPRLRQAVQHYALYGGNRTTCIFSADVALEQRLVGLLRNPQDLVFFMESLASHSNLDPQKRDDWRSLILLASRQQDSYPTLRLASRKFQAEDPELEAFATKYELAASTRAQPVRDKAKGKAARIRKLKIKNQRRLYRDRHPSTIAALRAGELNAIVEPAADYLKPFPGQPYAPMERLTRLHGERLTKDILAGFEATLHRGDIPSSAQIAEGLAKNARFQARYPVFAGLLVRLRGGHGFADVPTDVLRGALLSCNDPELTPTTDKDRHELRRELDTLLLATEPEREAFARLWIEPALFAGKEHIAGITRLVVDAEWRSTARILAAEWLTAGRGMHPTVEGQLLDFLVAWGESKVLQALAERREKQTLSDEQRLTWQAIDVLVRFDKVQPQLSGIGEEHPEFLRHLCHRFVLEDSRLLPQLSVAQIAWTFSQFRRYWPQTQPGVSGSADFSAYKASRFLCSLIDHLAADTGGCASEALTQLIAEPTDSYSDLIKHLATAQQQRRAEENIEPLKPRELRQLLTDGPPSNPDDLKALIVDALMHAQSVIAGDELDQVRDFWDDTCVPREENRCRDRLVAMLGPELRPYEISTRTEVDMPGSKRVDVGFPGGQWEMPMEIKGQWHDDVWNAATNQLDLQYLIHWSSGERGIYCVLWFGDLPTQSNRRLKPPPEGVAPPTTATQMRDSLVSLIPQARRALIDVVVLDLSNGREIGQTSRSAKVKK